MIHLHRWPLLIRTLLPGFLALLLLSPTVTAQSPSVQEGYLLADRLHAEPDPFSDTRPALGRDERVRVVPVTGEEGWHAVYRSGEERPVGYAFRPFISRLRSSDLAALQSDDGPISTQVLTPEDKEDGKLPSVVFDQDLSAADGVLVQVEQWANVRVGPGVGTEAFGVIRPGVPFRVLTIDRGWGKIKLQGQPQYGYVSGSLLHRVEAPVEEPVVDAEPEPEQRTAVTITGASAGGSATLGPEDGAEAEDVLGVEEVTGIVYVTRTGHKYHRADCKHLRSVKFAMPLAEALLDFAPCRTCTPPTRLPEDVPTP